MYGYSKHLFDLWALREELFDQVVGLKYFNVFGPFEEHKGCMRSMVHKSYEQILSTGKVKLFKSYRPEYADGEQMRDFIYVKDAVDGTLFFEDHREVSGLFNCGTGNAQTWNELVGTLFESLDREVKIEYIDIPESVRHQYQYFTQADGAKLRVIGYDRPFTPLKDAVQDYIESHLKPFVAV